MSESNELALVRYLLERGWTRAAGNVPFAWRDPVNKSLFNFWEAVAYQKKRDEP